MKSRLSRERKSCAGRDEPADDDHLLSSTGEPWARSPQSPGQLWDLTVGGRSDGPRTSLDELSGIRGVRARPG